MQSDLGLKPVQLHAIFSNLDAIAGFHKYFLEELSAKLTASDDIVERIAALAQALLKFSDFLKMYAK